MKNLLVANSIRTTAITESAPLLKGELVIKSINGDYVQTTPSLVSGVWKAKSLGSSSVDKTVGSPMYKYVVGLGNGKCIEGLWLNAENKVYTKQSYTAGAKKRVTIGTVEFDITRAMEATVHIQTQPKNALSGLDYQEFVATVPVTSTTDEATLPTKLLAEIQKVVANINTYFGKNVIKLTGSALNGLVFDAESTDFNFYVNFGGAAVGTTTSTDGITFGTQAEVIALEKEMAVATFGYNPNFEAGDHAYGEVFLAANYGINGYDIHVVTSVAPATDQMPLNAGAAKVEQWIALPTGSTTLA